MHINSTPGCERPADCRIRGIGLCAYCARRRARESGVNLAPPPPGRLPNILRIELTDGRRRHLGEMAHEARCSADELASRMLGDLIDDDAEAHSA